ncbi:MAG: GntR family transcriptional regulator [Bacteroidales bacterium]|nr:GntR family transcriptional regulator [Bacteroidales bacterium]
MVELGRFNKLRIVKEVPFGLYLDGFEAGEILLPSRYVPAVFSIDEIIGVFIYKDSEDRIIATTETPFAQAGEFALLRTVAVDRIGAFVQWGLMKDLLVPFSEQQVRMETGKSYIIRVFIDEKTQRIVGSGRIEKFLDKTDAVYEEGQEVDILLANQTDLGYKVIINNLHTGMLYENEIFQTVERGQKYKAFISKIRPDLKIDVCLQKPGYEKIDQLSERILQVLQQNNGFLPLNDKSDSNEIYALFHQSKKTFKKAIGALYKKKRILIEEKGIRISS